MAVNGRQKGSRAERKLVKLFEKWWGTEFFRTPGSGAFATRGFMHKDMDLAGDIVTTDSTFPFCVESKHVEGWDLEQLLSSDKTKIHSWWEQTIRETPTGKLPLLVFTRNRKPLFAMMHAGDASHLPVDTRKFMFNMNLGWKKTSVAVFLLSDLLETDPADWMIYERQERRD